MTLTRRDRAALSLALECLRDSGARPCDQFDDALDALAFGDDFANTIGGTVRASRGLGPRPIVLRARLALLLRAILRVDAIEREERDTGWALDSTRTRVVCAGCGHDASGYRHGELMTTLGGDVCPRTGRVERARNAVALWEMAAPEHRR